MDRVARATQTHGRRIGPPTIVVTALAVLAVGLAVRLLPAGPAHHGPVVHAAASGDVVVETPAMEGGGSVAPGITEIAAATVVNTTTAPIHVTGMSITPGPPSQFSTDPSTFTLITPNTCDGADIPPEGYCVATIRMVEHTTAEFDDNVNVSTSDGAFTGVLTNEAVPFYVLSTSPENPPNPTRLGFGATQVGSTSAAQGVTITNADSDQVNYEDAHIVGVSVTGADAADYRVSADGCTNVTLDWAFPEEEVAVPDTCLLDVVDKPGAVGDRPAILDVAYCTVFPQGIPEARSVGGGAPQLSLAAAPATCPRTDLDAPTYPLHLLILLDGNGPPGPTPPSLFSPTLTTSPAVVQGGRNTQVSGTGFPADSPVVVALRTIGSPTVTSPTVLAALPQAFHVTTNAAGAFTAQTLVVMPNVTPGNYPLEAVCTSPAGAVATVTINLLVVPGTAQPPQFVNRN